MARIAQEMRVSPEVMARYEPVIGLEVHAQLRTLTKAFCGCSTRFGDAPNKNTCPVCLGLPGALPVLNRKAVELAVRASLALQARTHERSRFARKNYFYPDLPKGYQISMYELPLATGGVLEIEIEGRAKKIGITRLHMEEDAAKNLHEGFPDSDKWSYIDFNRGGVPLVEIVSEPDIRTPAEAYQYLNTLKQVLEYTDVSDCKMEEGSLRCDANVSVRPLGEAKFGTKVEVKNLNSFRYLSHALEFEIERQIGVLESGGSVTQETRLWHVARGRTESMRSKEFAHDYRYFPDPDLLPVTVSDSLIAEVRAGMPELPNAKRERLRREYGISSYEANVLSAMPEVTGYFEATVTASALPGSLVAPWITGEFLRHSKEKGFEGATTAVSAAASGAFIRKVHAGDIPVGAAKTVYTKMFETGKSAGDIVAAEGLTQITDPGMIERIERQVVEENPEDLAKYRAGNEGLLNFFVGKVMAATRGQANPQEVNRILRENLRLNHEIAVARNFLATFTETTGPSLAIARAGKPPEPDVIVSQPNSSDEIGVEIASTYLSREEAKFTWDTAVRTFVPVSVWSSGVIPSPDDEFRKRLLDVVTKKLGKKYSTKRTWLVVEFNYWLGDISEVQSIVESVSQSVANRKSCFEAIWVVWQATNTESVEHKIFQIM